MNCSWNLFAAACMLCIGCTAAKAPRRTIPESGQAVRVFSTEKASADRLAEKQPLAFEVIPAEAFADNRIIAVQVDPSVRFQTIEGFGGAFTEAAAVTLYKLSPGKRERIIKAYFDPQEGIGYTVCRSHINSCDFSTGNYAYDETPGDFELKHFSIDRDRQALIPMIKEAMRTAGVPIKIFMSPWSPPAWMKTNGQMNRGGKLKPECRDAWARYFCKSIREYGKEGIPVWGLTVQNEPEATQTWDSCVYTPEETRDFVRDYLGPALEKEGLGSVRVIVYDHNRNRMYEWAKTILDDKQTARFVWGVGFHWYAGDNFDNVRLVHDVYPDKSLIFTEGCNYPFDFKSLTDWTAGENYGRSMVNDLNRWTVAWVDWNMLLDETGGPNHVKNFCLAPVHADTRNDSLHFMNSFYYIGHFSKFIKPGAVRIACASAVDALETTAFENPDGTRALVVMNRTESSVPFAIRCGSLAARTESPARSIRTFVF